MILGQYTVLNGRNCEKNVEKWVDLKKQHKKENFFIISRSLEIYN